MSRKPVLGRGLASLLPEADEPRRSQTHSGVRQISLDMIDANHLQPRTEFDEDRLAELAASIRVQGVLQPVVVRHKESDDRYELIAGERRVRASRRAGLTEIPALVKQVEDGLMLELALIENIQRDDLNALETARAYQQLHEGFSHSHEEIARRVGKDRSTVTNHLRLLHLPEAVQRALLDGEITMGHARALLGLEDPGSILAVLQQILDGDLSVRDTERRVQERRTPPTLKKTRRPDPEPRRAELHHLTERLKRSLAAQVQLTPRGEGARLVIEVASPSALDEVLRRLLPEDLD